MMFGGQTTEADSIRIIHKAIDLGINFVDTADMYVTGESERIVGKAIAERRDQVVSGHERPQQDGRRPQRLGHEPAAHAAGARREPAAAEHGLHRPVLRPRAGLRHADRRDAAVSRRRGASGQDPLSGLLEFSRLARLRSAVDERQAGTGSVRRRAAALQPGEPRYRGGAVAAVPGAWPGRRQLQPAGPRHSDGQVQAGRSVSRRAAGRPATTSG